MPPPASPVSHAHPSPPRTTTIAPAPADAPEVMSSSPNRALCLPIFKFPPPSIGTLPSIFNRPITPPPQCTPRGQIWWRGCGRAQPKHLANAESGWVDADPFIKRKDSNTFKVEQRRRLYNGSPRMSPMIANFVRGYLEKYLEEKDARRVLERVNDGEERYLGVVQGQRKIRKEVLEKIERMEVRFLALQGFPNGPDETGKFHEDKPVKRTLWAVIKGCNSAGNVALAKKEDDELRKSNYWSWSMKHENARREKEKQEVEEEDGERYEKEEQQEQQEAEEDDANFWDQESGDDDEQEEEDLETYLAKARMEQIQRARETDRLGRRHDLDGDLIPEPEPDFWTTREIKDVPPATEEERRIRLERNQRTRDRRERERRDREAEKAWVEDEDVEMTIDGGGELDTENGDGAKEDGDVEIEVEKNEPDARDPDLWLRRPRPQLKS